jgi:3-dehydroquinate synthase
MQAIKSQNSTIYFNNECYNFINNHLRTTNYSKLFIIVDQNTLKYCYPDFCSKIETKLDIEIIQIEDGEINKNIDTCLGVWNALSELNADRKCLIINLGGGVVTDLGGFVASTYKRGVNYINVPTSLLAMVDASVGGKTGIDLGSLKNQIGVISNPETVLIDTSFLKTLPQNEMRSGLAEMLKHGLIRDNQYWNKMIDLSKLDTTDLDNLIYESVVIKNDIVTKDPLEKGLRKTLNFGHTLGHAIESYHLENQNKKTLLHGEAIAIGMVLACFISTKKTNFNHEKCNEVKNTIIKTFGKVHFEENDIDKIIEFMKFDKKNSHGNINFVLLSEVGRAIIDQTVENTIIRESFKYYLN